VRIVRSHPLLVCGLLVAVATIAGSCGGSLSTRHAKEVEFRTNSKIAILPFDNYTDQDLVAAKITAYFEVTMSGRSEFSVIENGTTFEALRRLRIRSVTVLRKGQIDSLAQALQADYLLTGSVLEYREVGDKFLVKIPQVSINARLID
jgi:TolB-like protein